MTPSLPWKCSTTELRRRILFLPAPDADPLPGAPDFFEQNVERETGFEPATLSLEG